MNGKYITVSMCSCFLGFFSVCAPAKCSSTEISLQVFDKESQNNNQDAVKPWEIHDHNLVLLTQETGIQIFMFVKFTSIS